VYYRGNRVWRWRQRSAVIATAFYVAIAQWPYLTGLSVTLWQQQQRQRKRSSSSSKRNGMAAAAWQPAAACNSAKQRKRKYISVAYQWLIYGKSISVMTYQCAGKLAGISVMWLKPA